MDPAHPAQEVLMVLTVPLGWELVHCLGPHCSSVKHTRIKNKQRMANLFTISYSSWFNYILKVNRGKKWSALSDKRSKKSDTQQRDEVFLSVLPGTGRKVETLELELVEVFLTNWK